MKNLHSLLYINLVPDFDGEIAVETGISSYYYCYDYLKFYNERHVFISLLSLSANLYRLCIIVLTSISDILFFQDVALRYYLHTLFKYCFIHTILMDTNLQINKNIKNNLIVDTSCK